MTDPAEAAGRSEAGARRVSLSQNPTLLRRNRELATQALRYLQEGSHCALLGPHFSGKTGVIHAMEEMIAAEAGWPCVYLDLYQLEASTQRGFFAALAALIAAQLADLNVRGSAELTTIEPAGASSAAFRGFLTDAVLALRADLVLILDHLEALPNDLIQALLTSLRAAYMEQQTLEHRLMVVVSGALSLATVTVGESSPFRGIARRVFVSGLTESESDAFLGEQIEADWIDVSETARYTLYNAARGDPNLLWRIYRDAVNLARNAAAEILEAETVEQITDRFLSDEVSYYAPLQEAVRAIEQDPDLLRCVLLLLEHETVALSQLPLPLSPDLDPLHLTGVVEKVSDSAYRLRNGIYRRFLAQHFDPGRVGYLLTTAGLWDLAIDYLEASISAGNDQYRWNLFTAIVNSMYASEDLIRAGHFVLRGLSAGFGILDAQVWLTWAPEPGLRLVAHMGRLAAAGGGEMRSWRDLPAGEDSLAARAYREAMALRGPETADCVERAIPLLTPGRRPIGVLRFNDCVGRNRFAEQRERELQLAGYLSQAARALEQVGRRTQELALAGRVQASLLPSMPSIAGWEMAAILRPARQTAGDFFDFIPLPGGRLGIVIADVADKGMGAALYMALSRTLIRSFAADYLTQPDQVMRAASARMLSDAGAGMFVTVFYGILDPATGRLVYCNAGHHPPFLIGNGEMANGPLPLSPTGMALGVVDDAHWQRDRVQIAPGQLLFLYTDGVVEAQNHNEEMFGPERMLRVMQQQVGRPARQAQDAVIAAIQDFTATDSQSDDITLVVVRRGLGPGPVRPEPLHPRRMGRTTV